MDYMYIVWAVVIAASMIIEYYTLDFSAICLGVSAIIMLLLNAIGVDLQWQIIAYVVMTALLLIFVRPVCKKFFDKNAVPTNADANIGKTVKLLDDTDDKRSTVKLNDIVWTVICGGDAKKGDLVEITGIDGNKLSAKILKTADTKDNNNDNKDNKKGEK